MTVKVFAFAIMGSKYISDPRCPHESLKYHAAFLSKVRRFLPGHIVLSGQIFNLLEAKVKAQTSLLKYIHCVLKYPG